MHSRRRIMPLMVQVSAVMVMVLCVPARFASAGVAVQRPTAPPDADQRIDVVLDEWRPAYPVVRPTDHLRAGAAAAPIRGAVPLSLDFIPVGIDPEGDTPSDMAFSADGSMIVIAHRDTQNLVVMDAETRAVLSTIPLSGSPNSLALAADGVHAVTANIFENTASIVELTTGSELAVVPVGSQPGIVRLTPDGSIAVVGNTLDSNLSVIDVATATELRRISGAEFGGITSLGTFAILYKFTGYEIAPDNNTAIFPDLFNARVRVFDLAAGTFTTLATQPNPAVIDLSPDGSTAVVSHSAPQSLVSVIDVPSRSITKVIPVGGSATTVPPIAMNPLKTKAVVAVLNNVRVVNLVTETVSGDLSTGAVNDLAATADGQYCMVGNFSGSLVSFATETIVASLLNTTTPDHLAVSPAGPRAATGHALRKEFVEVMNVNGAAGYLEDVVPTGPPPEGDKARGVAVSSSGDRAVVINNHSHNATIMDLESGTVEATVAVGERPGAVAITPDESTAVVANLDSTFASVIDLDAGTATNVMISTRGSQVAISPDGQYAYIPVVASGDGVWRINLDTLTVAGPKIPTGNMGGVGFIFDQSSGMSLSHDGATLVTCGSFDNNISIIDTAAWTEVARVGVGSFPVRAAFSPDDSTIYVTNRNSDTVSVVSNAGAASTLTDTVLVADFPYVLTTDPAGTAVYVANFNGRSVSVIDASSGDVTDTIDIPPTGGAGQPVGLHVSSDGARLYVAANGGDFHVIDAAEGTIDSTINIGVAPAALEFNDQTNCGYVPSPNGDDGLSIVCLEVATGDADGDGDVDGEDYRIFADCLDGPGVVPDPPPPASAEECLRTFDFDLDDDVDLADFMGFALVFTGSP